MGVESRKAADLVRDRIAAGEELGLEAAGLDARHLPDSWASTGNSLEALAFAANDALFVVDDFAPSGSTGDVQRYHKEADRLLRAQGNRAGRGRARPDGSVRAAKPPRGTILSTGEDVPRGQSLRARLLVLELSPGQLDWDRLTAAQRDAAAGKYAAAMAGYLRWLAPRIAEIRATMPQRTAAVRERHRAEGQHARTVGITADLDFGLSCFLDFARDCGAISADEHDALGKRCGDAMRAAAAKQVQHNQDADPCDRFLRLLAAALSSGRAHLAGPDGGPPADPAAWGWRATEIVTHGAPDTHWEPRGDLVGWVDGAGVYLEREAAFAAAQAMGRGQGETLAITTTILWKRMDERGLLASRDAGRERLTIRKTLGGRRSREVLHLTADALSTHAGEGGITVPEEPTDALNDPEVGITPEPRDFEETAPAHDPQTDAECAHQFRLAQANWLMRWYREGSGQN
jgi:hypothetical protein